MKNIHVFYNPVHCFYFVFHEKKTDAISVLIARSSHPVWIGMYLDQSERKWIRGDVINYTNWYPKQILDTEKVNYFVFC